MVLACSGSGGGGGSAIYGYGEMCDASLPEDCPSALCRDVITGEASTSYSTTNFNGHGHSLCTKKCSGNADCSGMTFAPESNYSTGTETWTCSGGLCNVHVTKPSGGVPQDSCSGCGGAFCSGKCIGCPQC